jgi:hypothetical protein
VPADVRPTHLGAWLWVAHIALALRASWGTGVGARNFRTSSGPLHNGQAAGGEPLPRLPRKSRRMPPRQTRLTQFICTHLLSDHRITMTLWHRAFCQVGVPSPLQSRFCCSFRTPARRRSILHAPCVWCGDRSDGSPPRGCQTPTYQIRMRWRKVSCQGLTLPRSASWLTCRPAIAGTGASAVQWPESTGFELGAGICRVKS